MSAGTAALFALMVGSVLPTSAQENFQLGSDWWQQPAELSRHTTLVASFDSAQQNDGDYAREMPQSGGCWMNPDVPGKHGSATEVAETGGHLHFIGGSNFQAAHGTVRMQVMGELWAEETPRWLLETAGPDRIGIRREPGKLSLVFTAGYPAPSYAPPIAQLDLDIGDVSTDEWHSVVASWDRAAGRGWLALDGQGVTGEMQFPQHLGAAYMVYLAGGSGWREGLNLAGLRIDDFVLYDMSLPLLEAEPRELAVEDREFLPVVEAAARTYLNFVADRQQAGGWLVFYTWPTLRGSPSQGRLAGNADDLFIIDKGHLLTLVNYYLYAYEIMGDYRFLDVILPTAEILRVAQDPRGFWMAGYRMTATGPEALGDDTRIKMQDHDVAYPMYLFCYLHRVTGDDSYLEPVLKAGEFYLTAQNPNGSWPHHYDAQQGIGESAIGEPQAGELNDGATNDGIDVMALMYHLTGEGKYVQAIKRAGDWLVRVQGEDIPLWADQYDSEDRPAWARAFEPPGYGVDGTKWACQALREVYRFSGDDRYVDAIRRSVDWMAENLPEGTMWYNIEPGTGRPIAGWLAEGEPGQIYYLDDPEQMAFLETVPIGGHSLRQHEMLAPIQRILDSALSEQAALPPEVTAEGAMDRLPPYESVQTRADWRAFVQGFLDQQNEAGVWLRTMPGMGCLGLVFQSDSPYLRHLLYYIEQARVALGEIEPVYRGDGDFLKAAYPYADWYEVDWQVNTQ